MIRIQVYNADNLVQEFEGAPGKEITIGRSQGCSLHLDEASISRLHAVIIPSGGSWVLQRKASFGQVLLNGQEVENAPLEGGEEIQVGGFSLRIQIEQSHQSALTGSQNLVSTGSVSSATRGDGSGDGDGRTRFVSSGIDAFFRMEPGSANIDELHMDKDLVLFGRGSNCDIVLTEKKASRKHFEVRRQGLSFFLKDLNSANGTVVNGNAVTETELMSGDVIQVGETRIQFSIENKDYFSKQDQFLPVPAHLMQPENAEMPMGELGVPGMPGEGAEPGAATDGAELSPDGVPLPPKPNSSTDFIGWAKYKWFRIPKAQRMRYLGILIIGGLVMTMLGTPDDEMEKKKKQPPPRRQDGTVVRRFEDLVDKDKRFVIDGYNQLLAAHEKKDFLKMTEAARNILSLVDDYRDTKSYERVAKQGLEQIEEEKRKRESEEKQRRIREEVAKLEDKGQAVFERALKESSARSELDAVIQEIYAKDPNNRKAAEWKQRVKDSIEDEKRQAEEAAKKEELRRKAEDAYAKVEAIFKQEKFLEALKEAEHLVDGSWNEKEYLDKVEKLKTDIRTGLKNVLDPLLTEAKNQRQEGGDLVKARDKYREVLAIDKDNAEALRGISEIRDVLLLRAKRYYAEAILAESISELQEAKEKYEKCLHTAPDDPNFPPNMDYRSRCRRKLVRYQAFTPEQQGKN